MEIEENIDNTSCNARGCSRRKLLSSELLISEQVGFEALNFRRSEIGSPDYIRRAREKELLKLFKFSGLSNYSDLNYPFDGYLLDFNEINTEVVKGSVEILKKIFGKEQIYEGYFVCDFIEILGKSYSKVKEPQDINEALEKGFQEGEKLKTGFLIIVVKGNEFRPKDILIWNNIEKKWISYNMSQGYVYGKHKDEWQQNYKEKYPYGARFLENFGVVADAVEYHPEAHGSDAPILFRLSNDGVIWHNFFMDTDENIDLWDALEDGNEDMFVIYDTNSRKIQYQDKKTGLRYSNHLNFCEGIRARKLGYKMIELPLHVMDFIVDREDFPNLYLKSDEGVIRPFESLRVDEDEACWVPEILDKIKKISRKVYLANPEAKLFIDEVDFESYFDELDDYIQTEDGNFLNPEDYR